MNWCPICVRIAKTIHREETIISTVISRPDFRLKFYITYINEDLEAVFWTKYVLSLIDIFNRKGIIYCGIDKTAEISILCRLSFLTAVQKIIEKLQNDWWINNALKNRGIVA